MNKLLIAALAASAMSMATAAYAETDVDDSLLNRSIVADVDATLTQVDYDDHSLDVTGNDLMSNNTSYSRTDTSVEIDNSFTRISHDTSVDARLTNIGNEGFNDIRQSSRDTVAVNVGDTAAVYSYRPDNASFASNQNDFGDLHKVSVSAVGAISGSTISIGRTDER